MFRFSRWNSGDLSGVRAREFHFVREQILRGLFPSGGKKSLLLRERRFFAAADDDDDAVKGEIPVVPDFRVVLAAGGLKRR